MWNGEGNGTPLQYSCLENPMDGGAWWASGHVVAKSQTWMNNKSPTKQFATTALKSSQFDGMYIQLGSLSSALQGWEKSPRGPCCKNSFFMALRSMSPFPDWLSGRRGSPTPYHPTPPSVFKTGTWVPPTLCISGFPFCNQLEKTSPKRLLPQGQAHPGPLLVLQPTVPFDITWTWGWHLSTVPTPATAGRMCTLHMAMEIWGSILERCLQKEWRRKREERILAALVSRYY